MKYLTLKLPGSQYTGDELQVVLKAALHMKNDSAQLQACAIFTGFCVLFILFMGVVSAQSSRGLNVWPYQNMMIESND